MVKNKLAVNILFGVNGFLFANYTSRLPQVQAHYQIDNAQLGVSLLIVALGALLAMPLTSWLIAKKGSRRVAMIAALSLCCLVPGIGLMPSVIWLNLLLAVIGLATGAMDIAMNAQAIALETARRRPLLSSFHALYSAGMMVGAGSGSLFVAQGAGLGLHLAGVALLSLIFVSWASAHLAKDVVKPKAVAQQRFSWPGASLLGIGLIAFCCMLGEGAIANWSTNYMLHVAGANAALAPLGLVAFSSAMTLARFFGDAVRNRWGDSLLLIFNSLLAGSGLALVLLIPHPAIALIGFFLAGLGLSVIVPITYSTAGKAPNLPQGVGLGMVTTIGYAGLLLGPPVIGFLAEWQNMQIALSFALLLFVLMTVLSVRLRSPEGMV